MLQKLNERIQGVVAWVIISLIAFTFALFGIDYYLQGRHSSDIRAEVNDEPISNQAFELSVRRYRQLHDPAETTVVNDKQVKQQILEELIANKVSVQAAQKTGFIITPQQADAAIMNIPQFQEEGHFSATRYQQALSSALFTPASFQKEVRQGMLLNQQRFAFMGTAFALPQEVKRFVKLYMQARTYDYLEIPAKHFMAQVQVTKDEIKNYYEAHKQQFVTPLQVQLQFVELSITDMRDKVKVAPEEVKRFYEENKNNYLTPAQWQVAHIALAFPEDASEKQKEAVASKAQALYEKLKKQPENFAQEAKINSSDKLSAQKGGVLPWLTAGQTPYDKTLMHLTTPGDISKPAENSKGYEIFKLIAYKPATMKSFAEVKTQIKQQLIAEAAQKKYSNALESLSDLSYQTPDSLAPVAEALDLQIQETDSFTKQGGTHKISKNKKVVRAVFDHDVLELGNNSEPLQVDQETVVVTRVKKRTPAMTPPLTQLEGKITQLLKRQKASEKAKQVGKAITAAQSSASNTSALMKQYDLKWQTAKNVTRESDTVSVKINQLAFNAGQVGAEKGTQFDNGDYAVVRIKAIEDGSLKSLDKDQISSIRQQLEANDGIMAYDLYIGSLLNQAKITRQ